MKRNVNGKEVEIDSVEADEIQAEWDANLIASDKTAIANAKSVQKEKLIREKVESLLVTEFTEIDAAKTETEVKAVALKQVI